MKYIQIKPNDGLTDELHKEIKLKAIESNKSIPKYILDCVENPIKEIPINYCMKCMRCEEKKLEPPKEAKECEHEGMKDICYMCGLNEPKEPTVVSKEEEDHTVYGTNMADHIKQQDKENKATNKALDNIKKKKLTSNHPKEEFKHVPTCTCYFCKPPKTK